jgi:hypothetical protein
MPWHRGGVGAYPTDPLESRSQGPTVRVKFMAGGAQWRPVAPSGGKVRPLVGGKSAIVIKK